MFHNLDVVLQIMETVLLIGTVISMLQKLISVQSTLLRLEGDFILDEYHLKYSTAADIASLNACEITITMNKTNKNIQE